MKTLVSIGCLAALLLPAQARPIRKPATLQPAGTIQPASTGFSTHPRVPNRQLNSNYGVRRSGYYDYYYRYYNAYPRANDVAPRSEVPGYNKPLPDKKLPTY